MSTTVDRVSQGRRFIVAILTPAVLFSLQLQVGYPSVSWSCGHNTKWLLHVVSCCAVVGCALCLLFGLRPRKNDPLLRFMADLTVMSGVIFSFVSIALWAAVFVYNPCER